MPNELESLSHNYKKKYFPYLGVFANFFFALTGSDAHLVAKVLGFALGFWGVLKPSEVGEGVHFLL